MSGGQWGRNLGVGGRKRLETDPGETEWGLGILTEKEEGEQDLNQHFISSLPR